ncbi:AI-2E family transporter [Emcibacter sp. SYSU 3D8]|uniref:AI-2E family transporter n=1 Tax=Emcibacter sp. SYSU 3D8 TaxID=3133969 RepID=UPI0031FF1EC0
MSEQHGIERATFLVLLTFVSAAFFLVLWQFYGAILWAIAVTVVFRPVQRRILNRIPGRQNAAALLTLLLIITLVILPGTLIIISLLQEASRLYTRIETGQFDPAVWLRSIQDALPWWATDLLDRLDMGDLGAIREQLSSGLSGRLQAIATQALNIGQGALSFLVNLGIMLYLTFFLLRDGRKLTRRIGADVPLPIGIRELLFDKFLTVMRATMKGSFVVAVAQGSLGGLTFWVLGIHAPVLWGVLMAFLSLLPAVGTGFVWVPVAIYLLATGAMAKAVLLVIVGVFAIGLIDNILRPLLVGKDTKMPDYLVLITTLGGIVLFGLNGIILGPLIAAMFIAVWELLAAERRRADANEASVPPAD